ncbi:lysophospholipid acyltransferase family protein [Nannocystis pusilla]|uniref:1-acyl-sn-glycerol-3-phosphate acyltransferase n=1 Tax=Nannocystis pusilla TaxID=889268 RepID=A0ABS7TSI2_9BACT|nr:1-acyl-sn-glycerol-3-phosphate acyltransferase [Nannocystis pusilla]
MPKFLRIPLTAFAFFGFFSFGCIVGWLALPLLAFWPGTPEAKRRRMDNAICGVYRGFMQFLHLVRLVGYTRPELPPDFPRSGGYVVIANHPSLIDTLILMGLSPGLASVVKPHWYSSWMLRVLMRYAGHIPGTDRSAALSPSAEGTLDMSQETASDGDMPAVVDRMVAHLQSGRPLVIFPEASRSWERKMRRFRRGAVEAAVRAGVPIVPAFISVNPPMLMKHQPWYEVPERRGMYRVEFFPVIETAGRDLDPRQLNRELRAAYEVRFVEMLRERDASALAAAPVAQLPQT